MDSAKIAFKLREIVDIHFSNVTVADLLYGKVTAKERHALWDDILNLNLDEVDEDTYLKCMETMELQYKYLLTFAEELNALIMCIEKLRYNVEEKEDDIDG